MDVREKLVELLKEIVAIQECGFGDPRPTYETVASYLISHGVTVQDNTEITDEHLKQFRNAPLTVLREEPTIEAVQEWISVKDRLPTFYDADEDNCVLAIHKASNKRYYHWRSVADNPFDFTHWMKTPQPPKGE